MTSPSLTKVDTPGIAAMSLSDGTAEPNLRAGDNDQTYMIRHKAICAHCHAAAATPLGHKPDVRLVILITEGRGLPTISSLSYIVWNSRSRYSCSSGHDVKIP